MNARDKPTTTEQPISSELTSFLFFLPPPPPPLCSVTVDSSADASWFPELSANPFGFQRPTQDLRSIPFSSTKPQTHQLNQPNNHRSQPNHHRIQPSQPIKSNRPTASHDHPTHGDPQRTTTTSLTVSHDYPWADTRPRCSESHVPKASMLICATLILCPKANIEREEKLSRWEEERRERGRKREALKVKGKERVRLKNNFLVCSCSCSCSPNGFWIFLLFCVFYFYFNFFLFFFI